MREYVKLSSGVEIEKTLHEEVYNRIKRRGKSGKRDSKRKTSEIVDIKFLPNKLYHFTDAVYKNSIENHGLQDIDGYTYFTKNIKDGKSFITRRYEWNTKIYRPDILLLYEVDPKIIDKSKLYMRTTRHITEYLYRDSIPPKELKLNGIYKLMPNNSIILYRNYLLATGQKDKVKKLNLWGVFLCD